MQRGIGVDVDDFEPAVPPFADVEPGVTLEADGVPHASTEMGEGGAKRGVLGVVEKASLGLTVGPACRPPFGPVIDNSWFVLRPVGEDRLGYRENTGGAVRPRGVAEERDMKLPAFHVAFEKPASPVSSAQCPQAGLGFGRTTDQGVTVESKGTVGLDRLDEIRSVVGTPGPKAADPRRRRQPAPEEVLFQLCFRPGERKHVGGVPAAGDPRGTAEQWPEDLVHSISFPSLDEIHGGFRAQGAQARETALRARTERNRNGGESACPERRADGGDDLEPFPLVGVGSR